MGSMVNLFVRAFRVQDVGGASMALQESRKAAGESVFAANHVWVWRA